MKFLECMCHPDGGLSFFNDSVDGIAPTKAIIENYAKISSNVDIYKNLIESKYYDFFNIMIKSPDNTNYSYAIKVELL